MHHLLEMNQEDNTPPENEPKAAASSDPGAPTVMSENLQQLIALFNQATPEQKEAFLKSLREEQ